MSDQELELFLTEKCKILDLKQKAFEYLDKIFANPENDLEENFWCGFEKMEIRRAFDTFKFYVEKKHSEYESIIRTRIGLYVENKIWLNNSERIGFYELETDFAGEILDDWFVIEKEKHLNDIGIIGHFKSMNKKLPLEYLKRNHIQYELVTYISLIGTLFISKDFKAVATFVQRANTYLETTDNALIDKVYLKAIKAFLKMIKSYLEKQLIGE